MGCVLRLHPSFQQHLLVKLSLLLLLLQMLLYAETLPVVLLDLLCGVRTLDKHTCTQRVKNKHTMRLTFAEDVETLKQYFDRILFYQNRPSI